MLRMMRRIGEKIVIGDGITVTIVAIEGRQVQVSIDAPKDVQVDREEIYQKKQNARRQRSALSKAPAVNPRP